MLDWLAQTAPDAHIGELPNWITMTIVALFGSKKGYDWFRERRSQKDVGGDRTDRQSLGGEPCQWTKRALDSLNGTALANAGKIDELAKKNQTYTDSMGQLVASVNLLIVEIRQDRAVAEARRQDAITDALAGAIRNKERA